MRGKGTFEGNLLYSDFDSANFIPHTALWQPSKVNHNEAAIYCRGWKIHVVLLSLTKSKPRPLICDASSRPQGLKLTANSYIVSPLSKSMMQALVTVIIPHIIRVPIPRWLIQPFHSFPCFRSSDSLYPSSLYRGICKFGTQGHVILWYGPLSLVSTVSSILSCGPEMLSIPHQLCARFVCTFSDLLQLGSSQPNNRQQPG